MFTEQGMYAESLSKSAAVVVAEQQAGIRVIDGKRRHLTSIEC
jgi:hypothetical protein